jgi:dihydroneopterin aldolase
MSILLSILRLLADQMTVPEDQDDRQRPYRMFVRDLVLPCRIGVYDHEKLARQRVRINVSMRVEPNAGPRNDDIANVLSYDDLLAGIKALTEGEHINLVETLAEAIADVCLGDRRVVETRVTVEKLDVEPRANGVGVEIERRRRPSPGPAGIYPLPPWGGADGA